MANNRKRFEVSEERKNIVKVANDPSLLDVPKDVSCLIGSRFDTKVRSASAKTCKTFNNFFQSDLDKEAEPLVVQVLHYAAFGKMKELDTLLTKRPGLVYKRGTTVDPCGRTVHGTVYRIALGAKDWKPFPDKPFEEMAEMIERHMKTLPKGEEEIELQKAEQFPEGWEEQEKIREANDSAAVKKVFAAIDQSNTDDDCKDAIEEFISYLKSQNEVKIGYHYNDKLLSEAKNLYNSYYDKFDGFDSRKNKLAAIKIIGSIQGRMTACLAMAHCDGLGNVTEKKKQLSRRMTLDDGTPFFSHDLGSSHFVYSYYAVPVLGAGASKGTARGPAAKWGGAPVFLQTLCLAKTSSRNKWQSSTFKQSEPAKHSSCVLV